MEQNGSPRLVDARGHKAWLAHHLPGSVGLNSGGFSGAPGAEEIGLRLGKAGISQDDHLWLYDDGSGAGVGALLWLLDRVAHPRVSVLDGGITAWHGEGHPLESGAGAALAPVSYDANTEDPPRENLATKGWILDNMDREDLTLVDTRSESEYRGSRFGLKKTGHIPGALWLEWSDTLVETGSGGPRFATAAEMAPKLDALGITQDSEIVCYCQVGARSAQVYGVLRMLGFPRVRNYPGAWAEWGSDRNTPAEQG